MKSLFQIVKKGGTNSQQAAGISIHKIIQASPSNHFSNIFEFLFKEIYNYLSQDTCKAPHEMLESLLGICLGNQDKVATKLETILEIVLRYIYKEDPKVKKIAVDIVYTLCVITKTQMEPVSFLKLTL